MQMRGPPEDDMLGDLANRAPTRERSTLELIRSQRRDRMRKRILADVPTYEGAHLGELGSCYLCIPIDIGVVLLPAIADPAPAIKPEIDRLLSAEIIRSGRPMAVAIWR